MKGFIMKKKIVKYMYSAGAVIGTNAVLFRVVDLIDYSEMKLAALIAMGLLGTAFAIEKLAIK